MASNREAKPLPDAGISAPLIEQPPFRVLRACKHFASAIAQLRQISRMVSESLAVLLPHTAPNEDWPRPTISHDGRIRSAYYAANIRSTLLAGSL